MVAAPHILDYKKEESKTKQIPLKTSMKGIVSAKTYRRFVLLYQLGLAVSGVVMGAFALNRLLKAPILALLPMDILIGTQIDCYE